MKTIIKFSAIFTMFVIALLIIIDINFVSASKTELNDVIRNSERNVLKGVSINKMYEMNEEDMELELIRNIGTNMNMDNDVQVNILDVNKEGLIDVAMVSKFKHLNGKDDERIVRNTMITEEHDK